MEFGESSSSSKDSSDEIWAKLVPSDQSYSEIEIRSKEMIILSEITSSSSCEKIAWCKITRNPDQRSAILQNTSSRALHVDEVVIQREDDTIVNCGSEIVLGPKSEGYLSYRFKVMPRPVSCPHQLKVSIDADDAKCSICLNIWHDVVTVAPCLHNFCNGCFSEWLRRSQKKHSTVLCPQCRAVVQFAGRNHFLHSMEEDILQADTSLKQSDEEIALLDSYASIKSNLVIQSTKKRNRKRPHSLLEEDSDNTEFACLQCGSEVGGFHCRPNMVHLQCQACGGMMPSRPDIGVPQHCLGCNRSFCSAYWRAQVVTRSDSHPICNHDTFKPILERTISRIPFVVHEKNRHEQNITEACIRKMGRTLQDVMSEWIWKFNNREIDRTRLLLNHAETITAATHVCNGCYDELVSFLLYWFRITMPVDYLPPDAKNREDCWYGYACRTQHHNEEHARKRNHVCRPSRFTSM